MSDRGFKQLLIMMAVALLSIGVGYVWPPGLACLGIVALIVAVCMDPDDAPSKEGS